MEEKVEAPSLEEAIETLQCFAAHQKEKELLTLERFEMKDGALHPRSLSSLETALSCLMQMVSKRQRTQRKNIQKPMKRAILRSVDTVKIALIQLRREESSLKRKLLTVSEQYNTTLKAFSGKPKGFYNQIKYYFFKTAGWLLDKDLLESHISIPSHVPQTPYTCKLSTTPFFKAPVEQQEVDLFYAKARTLLGQHAPYTAVNDLVKSLRTAPLEATLRAESIISLKQKVSYLPGEEYELTGDFSRTGAMSIPIADSFILAAKALQTGYPHPCQSVGVGLAEGILPHYLVRSYLAPQLASLLERKEKIAQALLPHSQYNLRAKELLAMRKTLFRRHKAILLPRLKETVKALFESSLIPSEETASFFEALDKEPYFDTLSNYFFAAATKMFSSPFIELEKLWSEKKLTLEIYNDTLAHIQPDPASHLEKLFFKAAAPIGYLLFKEKLPLPPTPLDLFSKKLLILAITELERFLFEVELMPLDEEKLLAWIITLIDEKRSLLMNPDPTHPLVSEWCRAPAAKDSFF
jgi:hypothetical protein